MPGESEEMQSRKWLVTANNPKEHGLTREIVREKLSGIKGKPYWCLAEEVGQKGTHHIHLFIARASAFKRSQIAALFPGAHIDRCNGTCIEIRDYVKKDGAKYNKDESGHYCYVDASGKKHEGTNFKDTFEEHGDVPIEQQGKSPVSELIVSLVKSGATNLEIIGAVPSAYEKVDKINRLRNSIKEEKFEDVFRKLEITYIFGKSGAGKTRYVMEKYGYTNCCRVTDYEHPFDAYNAQDVIIFEEFRSSLKHGDMLNYLDGYPLLLPARYYNRQACYTKVYIITNIPPDEQYIGVDSESRAAFFRRIGTVREYDANGYKEYAGVDDYIAAHKAAKKNPACP